MATRVKKYNFDYQDYHEGNGYGKLLQQTQLQAAIDQVGLDVYYMPKNEITSTNYDTVFKEMSEKTYEHIYRFRCGIVETTFYDGPIDIFSQFGLTIEDEIKLVVTEKEFWEVMEDEEFDLSKGISSAVDIDFLEHEPEVDDLFYIDAWGGQLFRIKTVENPKYNRAWFLTCSLWKASSGDDINVDGDDINIEQEFIDIINTLDNDVDSDNLTEQDLQDAKDYPQPQSGQDQTGTYDVGEGLPFDYDNDNFEREADSTVKNNDKYDPFSNW